MQTRVYTDKINIDNNSTKEFWQKRANNINNLQTVLLGSDNTGSEQNIRNENEKRPLVKPKIFCCKNKARPAVMC